MNEQMLEKLFEMIEMKINEKLAWYAGDDNLNEHAMFNELKAEFIKEFIDKR